MAFLDDRLWCHPKWATLSDSAHRAGVDAICYSHGFDTVGVIRHADLVTLRIEQRDVDELLMAGLWEALDDHWVIHDYDDWNGQLSADERRRKQAAKRAKRYRERKAERDASRTASRDERDEARVTERDFRHGSESESESDGPPTPTSGGSRHAGTNPRANGTNPRARTKAAKAALHAELLEQARTLVATIDADGTDVVHEQLDALERSVGSRLTDTERLELVDAYVAGAQ